MGNFLFEQKKVVYPLVPFYVGSYKFSRVKTVTEFVKELEYFHFGEIIYHRNDSEKKVAEYCGEVGVHFEYADFWDKDEEIFRSAQNMTSFRRRLKQKITTIGEKGKVAEQLKRKEEDATKKRKEEAHWLVQEAENWLRAEEEGKKRIAEEEPKKIEEEKKRKGGRINTKKAKRK